ncbi:abortive infection protein, AbiV family [Halanaerobium salsuginis]|jgi:AbiV family abortive infection protein|uniref:Abortive infection protein, AbiV family n=1 Tax=Halanaerobium salsuginis TaxID=29563 RepID=A0A1I4M8A9_9FIRM|nr:abortive infection protein, AbiV family [Halanaerobium salsuginis]
MTAIEEIGKVIYLRMVSISLLERSEEELSSEQIKEIKKVIRNHTGKALQMANWSLFINSAADKRHGVHPTSGIYRTSGIVLLVRSGKWMEYRNNCLYTDIDFNNKSVISPSKISRKNAYYFICMAYEGLSEQAESGLGSEFEGIDGTEARNEWISLENELKKFIDKNYTNVDDLDFLNNADAYRELAEKRG